MEAERPTGGLSPELFAARRAGLARRRGKEIIFDRPVVKQGNCRNLAEDRKPSQGTQTWRLAKKLLSVSGGPLFALKGPENPAQGNALGTKEQTNASPERARETESTLRLALFQS